MKTSFLDNVASVLEADSVTMSTRFREISGWSSLVGFGLLVMLENDYGTSLPVERFIALETVRDLYLEAFVTFAARLLGVDRASLSPESAMGTPPEWDSVNHLRLVMEAEAEFGVSYRLEDIPAIKTIRDFSLFANG